jgi:hypothetical protein
MKKTIIKRSLAKNGCALAYSIEGIKHLKKSRLKWFNPYGKTSQVIDFTVEYLATH